MKRKFSISFVVSEKERDIIKKNAKNAKKSISAFVRERAIKPEMTNNELADMLMNYMAKRLDSVKKRGVERIREDSLRPPANLSAVLGDMTGDQQKKFKKKIQETTTCLTDLQGELQKVLEIKGLKE